MSNRYGLFSLCRHWRDGDTIDARPRRQGVEHLRLHAAHPRLVDRRAGVAQEHRRGGLHGLEIGAGKGRLQAQGVELPREVVAAIPLNVTLPDEPMLAPAITICVPGTALVRLVPLVVR